MSKTSANGLIAIIGLLLAPVATAQEAACVDGEAAGVARTYACSHVDLVGYLSLDDMGMPVNEVANDIWGWIDDMGTPADTSDDQYYVLLGTFSGTAFVRIEATGLRYLGSLPDSDGEATVDKVEAPREKSCHDEVCGGSDSSWRDIKVYGNHAYIVSEGLGHGVQVFDLTRLRGITTSQEWTMMDGYYGTDIGSAHNIFINEDSGRAYVVGGRQYNGGPVILDIATNPLNPARIGVMSADGYTHDIQCVLYSGPDTAIAPGAEICFASNEDTVTIWNATDPAAPAILSRASYSERGYTHQGWLDAEQDYFFFNDELDERNFNSRTHTRVLDVSDLSAPVLAGDYLAPTLAIDHNNYVHGDFLYQANYNAGLRILDISDRMQPVQAAYFDTQASDAASFQGTWSNYRFPNGLVALSDINDGLFVVEPTLNLADETDLAVVAIDVQSSITTGKQSELVFSVSNSSLTDASEVLFTASFGGDVEWAAATVNAMQNCSIAGQQIECRVDSIAAGNSIEIHAGFAPNASGTHELIAMVYAKQRDANTPDNLIAVDIQSKKKKSGGGGMDIWTLLASLFFATMIVLRRKIHE